MPDTPPLKIMGIKTKMVEAIIASAGETSGAWLEPFVGSAVTAMGYARKFPGARLLLSDNNPHIIAFYQALLRMRDPERGLRSFLERHGEILAREGEAYYLKIRDEFNSTLDPLLFLFLNRSCFNGVMRFNSKGGFNVPFCKKTDRFSPAMITKIVNQAANARNLLKNAEFALCDFGETFLKAGPNDVIYCDPPYIGLSTGYYSVWTNEDDTRLLNLASGCDAKVIVSTWVDNGIRRNEALEKWLEAGFVLKEYEHAYQVGPKETNRRKVVEGLLIHQ